MLAAIGAGVICEMRNAKCERVFCETTCETLCDWSIGRRVFRRLPVAVVVAATGAEGSAPHACSYSFITRRTVYVQGSETVCVNMLSQKNPYHIPEVHAFLLKLYENVQKTLQ